MEDDKNDGISIIIPCLNEEFYLEKLLRCLVQQTYKNFEVIIVDGNSKDKTCEIAQKYIHVFSHYKILTSDKRQIAHQRNMGAKNAKYEQLLFLDADVQINRDFLSKTMNEITKRRLDMATVLHKPLSKRFDDNFLFFLGSYYIQIMQYLSPVSIGWCIFCTKTVHQRIKGFSESVKFKEDFDYAQRAVKSGAKLRVLSSTIVYASVRRLQEEGLLNFTIRAVKSDLYRLFNGKCIKEPPKREFGHFKKDKQADMFGEVIYSLFNSPGR